MTGHILGHKVIQIPILQCLPILKGILKILQTLGISIKRRIEVISFFANPSLLLLLNLLQTSKSYKHTYLDVNRIS